MIEIIIQFISAFKSVKIETNIDTNDGTKPWIFWMQKTPAKDIYRILLTNRTKINVLNLHKILYFGQNDYVDVVGFVYKGKTYTPSSVKSIFKSLLFNNRIKIFKSINASSTIVQRIYYTIELYKFSDEYTIKLIQQLHNIFNTQKEYTTLQSFIGRLLSLRILSYYIKRSDITNVQTTHAIDLKRQNFIKKSIKASYWNFSAKNLYPTLTLDQYTQKEIDAIDTHYNLHLNYIEKTQNNACDHVKILYHIQKLVKYSTKLMRLKMLERFMSNKDTKDAFIICNICGLPILCPHLYRYMVMKYSNINMQDILVKLNEFTSFNKKTTSGSCKICNDEIGESLEDDQDGSIPTTEYYLLKKKMTMDLLLIYAYIKTTPEISQFEFVNFIKNALFPLLINSKNAALAKLLIAHDDMNAVSSSLHIYIVMYVYAFILNMVRAYNTLNDQNYVKITFREKIKNDNIKEYGNVLIAIFMNKYDGLNRNNLDINVLSVLEAAYLEIYKSNVKLLIKDVVGKNNIVYYSIINQSVFKYAHKIYNTFSNSNSNNITEKVFHEITGYSTLEMSKIGYNTHVNILEKIYKPPYKNEIKYTTFDAGYEKDLMYLNYMIYITGDKTKYEDLALYNTVLEYKSIIDRYIPCYLDSYLGDKYVKNLYLTKYKSLGLVYDEQGNEHNWNIFILKDKEVNRGKYPSAQIFGYRCSICKATMTDVLKLNNYTISKILLKKTVNSSILSYLYNTCPEHNVHVFVDNVCTKCGYMRNVVDPLLPAVDAYVNKYKTFYEKLIDTTHKHTTTVIVEKQIVYCNIYTTWYIS
jgi:hypothetical protein